MGNDEYVELLTALRDDEEVIPKLLLTQIRTQAKILVCLEIQNLALGGILLAIGAMALILAFR